MAVYGAEGIVLGTRSWGEADKVVTLYTKEHGLVASGGIWLSPPAQPTGRSNAAVRPCRYAARGGEYPHKRTYE